MIWKSENKNISTIKIIIMEIEITQPRLVDVRYIKVDAGVRYWQDTTVNGERDIDFCESKGVGTPKIPFAVKVKVLKHKYTTRCATMVHIAYLIWSIKRLSAPIAMCLTFFVLMVVAMAITLSWILTRTVSSRIGIAKLTT